MQGNHYGDPLRPLTDLEGILVNIDDLTKSIYIRHGGTVSLNDARKEAIQHMLKTSEAMESLYKNQDFIQFIKHINMLNSTAERWVYHPAITSEAKGAWFNQLNTIKGVVSIIEYFRMNNSAKWNEILNEHEQGMIEEGVYNE